MAEHVPGRGDHVEAYGGGGAALAALDEPARPCGPGERSCHDPASGQRDGTALRLGQFGNLERDDLGCIGICGCLTGAALVDIAKPEGLSRCIPDVGGRTLDRAPMAHSGRCDVHGEQVVERIHGHTHLRAALAPGIVEPSVRATLRCRAQGAAVDDRARRLFRATSRRARRCAQVLRQLLETSRCQPALRLLTHGRPRREVVRHGAPGDAVAHHLAQVIERPPHGTLTLRRRLRHQRRIRDNRRPFLVADLRRAGLARWREGDPSSSTPSLAEMHNSL